jgi:hypothetical protein
MFSCSPAIAIRIICTTSPWRTWIYRVVRSIAQPLALPVEISTNRDHSGSEVIKRSQLVKDKTEIIELDIPIAQLAAVTPFEI